MSIAEDLAGITSLQSCHCQVWQYHLGHSVLDIRVSQTTNKEDFWLSFEGVHYFEGPLLWKGADFELQSPTKALELLREKLGVFSNGLK